MLTDMPSICMSQDTGLNRTNTKDQFYTKPEIAKLCVDKLLASIPELADSGQNAHNFIWLEPSAGSGVFVNHLPDWVKPEHKISLDIDPMVSGNTCNIQKQDYLTWCKPSIEDSKKFIVYGNPPFGRQSKLAKAFITKSCSLASIIAFILPKSFVKPSMNRVFQSNFHCIHSSELPKMSFLLNGVIEYDVPCVFQIWQKLDNPRLIQPVCQPKCFKYVSKSMPYDLVFRRVGVYAGRAYNPILTPGTYSEQSHYFISLALELKPHLGKIIEKINNYQFPTNTVGPRSISKPEASQVINNIIDNIS